MKMKNKLDSFADNFSTKNYIIVLAVSLVGFIFSNVYLGILFEKTGYPVQLIVSQTRFSASMLKSDFSVLIEKGTLGDYILIQYLDVGIMISTAVFFTMLTLFFVRKIKSGSSWRKWGLWAALLFPISSLLDGIENTFLLIMLSNPLQFSDWLAISYSSSALLKLGLFVIGLICLIVIPIAGTIAGRRGGGNKTGQYDL